MPPAAAKAALKTHAVQTLRDVVSIGPTRNVWTAVALTPLRFKGRKEFRVSSWNRCEVSGVRFAQAVQMVRNWRSSRKVQAMQLAKPNDAA